MKFSEKIAKILKHNDLKITSPSQLEEFIKAGKGSITTRLRKGDSAGPKTEKKIIEKLRINQEWWDTGEGEMYINEFGTKQNAKIIDADVWNRLEKDNTLFEKNNAIFESEIQRLWTLIDRLAPPPPPAKKESVKTNGK